jgi:hypothetical protein
MTWNDQFLKLYRESVEKYRGGNDDFHSYYTPDDIDFLASIGYKPRELFDFVEDLVDAGEPTESTALLIASVRRDYFLTVQQGIPSKRKITTDELPTFGDSLEEAPDLPYLPRILAKGRAKLKGELDPDIMFGCGGDRNFLKNNGNIHPADFLRHIWAGGDSNQHIVAYIQAQSA